MKKNLIAVGFLSLTLICCDKVSTSDSVMLVVDTYSREKSTGTYPSGNFDSSPVEVYLEDDYIGTTPLILKESDLKRLNLPSLEKIETGSGHWDTWDIGKNHTMVIRFKEDKQNRRKLDFRSGRGSATEGKKFRGFTKGKNLDGVPTILVQFPQGKSGKDPE